MYLQSPSLSSTIRTTCENRVNLLTAFNLFPRLHSGFGNGSSTMSEQQITCGCCQTIFQQKYSGIDAKGCTFHRPCYHYPSGSPVTSQTTSAQASTPPQTFQWFQHYLFRNVRAANHRRVLPHDLFHTEAHRCQVTYLQSSLFSLISLGGWNDVIHLSIYH
jgi:hypothetical protein